MNVTPRILIFCTRFGRLMYQVAYVKFAFLSFVHKDYLLTLTKIKREIRVSLV